jgi:hypothetical protein
MHNKLTVLIHTPLSRHESRTYHFETIYHGLQLSDAYVYASEFKKHTLQLIALV